MRRSIFMCVFMFAAFAIAKDKRIRWVPVEGSTHYEIQISQNQKKLKKIEIPAGQTEWKSDLGPGIFVYQLRAIDKVGRPGKWSLPRPILVAPEVPKILAPKSDVNVTSKDSAVILKWEPVNGATEYQVTVERAGESVFSDRVVGTEKKLPDLLSGVYEWTLRSVISAKGELPPGLRERSISSESAPLRKFFVAALSLGTPYIHSPGAEVPLTQNRKVTLGWKPVKNAEGYEVAIMKQTGKRLLASEKKISTFVVKESTLEIEIEKDARYRWGVRALAKMKGKSASIKGPVAKGSFAVVEPLSQASSVSLDVFAAPFFYSYVGIQGLNGLQGSPLASRYGGEFTWWFQGTFGAGLGAESEIYRIEETLFARNRFSLSASHRLKFAKTDWLFKLGVQSRDFFELVPTGNQSGPDTTVFRFGTLGPFFGARFERSLGKRFSVGVLFDYFFPGKLFDVDNGRLIYSNSFRNISLGGELVYWLSREWAITAGYTHQSRNATYERAGMRREIDFSASVLSAHLRWEKDR